MITNFVSNKADRFGKVGSVLRCLAGLGLLLLASAGFTEKILLIPLDSRPACGQFPQMIGRIAGVSVEMPPDNLLGRFTSPGKAVEIGKWLLNHDMNGVIAVCISTDMVAFGGLIESRSGSVPLETAQRRLDVIRQFRSAHPTIPIYAFSSLMRSAPTATTDTMKWRLHLARYVELQDRYARTGDSNVVSELNASKAQVPRAALRDYFEARKRNMEIHKSVVRLVSDRTLSYVVIGVDDSLQYGPHHAEVNELRKFAEKQKVGGWVYIGEGVDQDATLMVSRALMKHYKWMPKISVELSDPSAAERPSTFESQPLRISIRDQILASGGVMAEAGEKPNYTFYLNTKGVLQLDYAVFAEKLESKLDEGASIAIADINFDKTGSGDERLLSTLWKSSRIDNLLSYAAWNTAGNTIGTAIPQANVYLLAKKIQAAEYGRELAQREFLFHRLVNDYGYHKFIRPQAYKIADADPDAIREFAAGDSYFVLQGWVSRNTKSLIEKYFDDFFKNHEFTAGGVKYSIDALKDLRVVLPWPRAFEVRIEFGFVVSGAKSRVNAR